MELTRMSRNVDFKCCIWRTSKLDDFWAKKIDWRFWRIKIVIITQFETISNWHFRQHSKTCTRWLFCKQVRKGHKHKNAGIEKVSELIKELSKIFWIYWYSLKNSGVHKKVWPSKQNKCNVYSYNVLTKIHHFGQYQIIM